MSTGSDIFSSPRQEDETNDSLTQRLYQRSGPIHETSDRDSTQTALEELRRLAAVQDSLERRHDHHLPVYQEEHTKHTKDYFDSPLPKSRFLEYGLYELTGFSTEEAGKSYGGHYIRWKGKGIVINPGYGFFENFHHQTLGIQDIDFVIITRNHAEAYGDIKKIYEMNNEWNKHSSENHIIRYYLQQNAYQKLATGLKPNYRNARNTVFSLDTFLDSPDVENIELDDGIRLHYHLVQDKDDCPLVIRLELTDQESHLSRARQGIRVGYISGMGWSSEMSSNLGRCDILLAGFGTTNPDDYALSSYNQDSLGYNGTLSLLRENHPYLLLLTEFSGREGDLRIDATKKIRHDLGRTREQASIALPGDVGLVVDLISFQVQCSISHNFVDPAQVRIVKTHEDFGRLQYLSPSFCI